ncbi:hypothetical protein T11_12031 [Trichinella zimbabwensis]|uniref:Uncharacterized protein n=1 Tax=Trichinella zimbabwensis TaxID=268475 RepID=A0A0V1GRJ2_9BILA|nr:hypothetical protein T11_16872 [Trichinella zimbabwensis]KRZ00936.1 hypothetical protein T11_4897 [Trichinella zimbabwensis]KRZ01565.1 hypothetical protein T11_12031 [Trichinella zimbabwensis]
MQQNYSLSHKALDFEKLLEPIIDISGTRYSAHFDTKLWYLVIFWLPNDYDKIFTRIPLAEDLLGKKTTIVRTLRKNKKEVPSELTEARE